MLAKKKEKCIKTIHNASSCVLQLKQQPIKFRVMNMFDVNIMGNVTNVKNLSGFMHDFIQVLFYFFFRLP